MEIRLGLLRPQHLGCGLLSGAPDMADFQRVVHKVSVRQNHLAIEELADTDPDGTLRGFRFDGGCELLEGRLQVFTCPVSGYHARVS